MEGEVGPPPPPPPLRSLAERTKLTADFVKKPQTHWNNTGAQQNQPSLTEHTAVRCTGNPSTRPPYRSV